MTPAYRPDLAYIHDSGFGELASAAARVLLVELRRRRVLRGRVVDLGCGSGILAHAATEAGYRVHGIDISPAMIALAQTRVPEGTFVCGSLDAAAIPACNAVAAVGEVLNYEFGGRVALPRLARVFGRVFQALVPGGVFLFDLAGPGRVPGGHVRGFREGTDWAVLFSATEDARRHRLTRRITTFRRVGDRYCRDDEEHHQRLFDPGSVVASLRAAGFRVRRLSGYHRHRFPVGLAGFLASRPE